MVSTTEAIAHNSALDELLPLLQRLDQLLEKAIAAAQLAYGAEAANDPYRGLHVNPEDVARSLSHSPGVPLFQLEPETFALEIKEDSRLAWLQQTFELSAFDLDVIAIALAPELDRRYDRLYAYLQDDVRCKRPSVDLALNLLCPNAAAKLARRIHFAPDAPLIRHNLLHLIAESDRGKPTLLAREFHLDDQVVRFLLEQPGLDERLAPFCQLISPTISLGNLLLNVEIKKLLSTLSLQSWQQQKPLQLYFQGTDRPGRMNAAEALATELKLPLLTTDLARISENKTNFEVTLKLIFREAWFQKALLYLEGLDVLYGDEQAIAYQCLMGAIAQHPTITILSGVQSWIPAATEVIGIVTLPFPIPDLTQRRDCWQTHLTAAQISLDNADLDAIANRFRLTPHQIASAVKSAENAVRWQKSTRSPDELPQLTIDTLFTAARAQSGRDLAKLTRKIEPKYRWDDIVLPPDAKTQLREICNQEKYRHLVHETWGFDRKLSLGKGLNVLFSGSPGTGKTMAAEVIAHELQLDLYKIDLSQVVSKYIGETEKNLNGIFTAATNANAILLFDEADALFGKRSEVKDAHDRYANIEIGYLLQKMEEYEGIAILTTNFRSNLDDAFVRRLRFIIEFPFPNERYRRQIWQKIWQDATPCHSDLDLDFLARQFEITGANIRNIALAAAFFAADDGAVVNTSHLIRAIRREYQKMGKILMEEEFGKYGGWR
jgi:AAA+ superfamily predicted ATPase